MKRFAAMTAAASMTAAAMTAAPALAQDDMAEADRAAEEMMAEIYVYDTVDYKTPSQIIANLLDRGYTNIEEFDVEWGSYEVEAVPPGGTDEMEIEIDPVTGAITDIDENWF